MIASMEAEPNGGRMKCAAACGKITPARMCHQLNNDIYMKAYGVPVKESVLGVKASDTRVSGRLEYENKDGKEVSFEIGNFIQRRDYKSTKRQNVLSMYSNKCKSHREIEMIEAYCKEASEQYELFCPYFLEDCASAKAKWKSKREEDFICALDWSVNHINQYRSRVCVHKDPFSWLPTLLSQINPLDGIRDWCGGELFLPEAGFVLDYGKNDLVLMMSNTTWHTVLPMCPKINVDTNERGQCYRMSIVHYNNKW